MHGALKAFAWLVLALMGVALIYASYIAITNWSGIGV